MWLHNVMWLMRRHNRKVVDVFFLEMVWAESPPFTSEFSGDLVDDYQDCVNCHCGKRIEPVFGKRMQHGKFKHPWPASPSERRKSRKRSNSETRLHGAGDYTECHFCAHLSAVLTVINVLVRHHNDNGPYHPCMVYLPTFVFFSIVKYMVNVGKYTRHGCYSWW